MSRPAANLATTRTRTYMQALARLTHSALGSCKRPQLQDLAACTTQVLQHDSTEQQRCFGALTSSAISPVSRGNAVTVPIAPPAQLFTASWHGLHALPLVAASDHDPGQRCENHDHDHHHPHQPSPQAKHPVTATAGQPTQTGQLLVQLLQVCKALHYCTV